MNVDEGKERRDRRFLALILIVVGLLALVPNIVTVPDIGPYVLPVIGVVVLAYGLFAWRYGATVAGSIMTGLGVGVLFTQTRNDLTGNVEGGIIVLCLAAGFIGVALMNVLFERKAFWWPLIPGVILGVVGALLTIDSRDSINLLEQIGRYWPILLMLLGVWMLLRHDEGQRAQE
jgi:uncharacterized membrane protein